MACLRLNNRKNFMIFILVSVVWLFIAHGWDLICLKLLPQCRIVFNSLGVCFTPARSVLTVSSLDECSFLVTWIALFSFSWLMTFVYFTVGSLQSSIMHWRLSPTLLQALSFLLTQEKTYLKQIFFLFDLPWLTRCILLINNRLKCKTIEKTWR